MSKGFFMISYMVCCLMCCGSLFCVEERERETLDDVAQRIQSEGASLQGLSLAQNIAVLSILESKNVSRRGASFQKLLSEHLEGILDYYSYPCLQTIQECFVYLGRGKNDKGEICETLHVTYVGQEREGGFCFYLSDETYRTMFDLRDTETYCAKALLILLASGSSCGRWISPPKSAMNNGGDDENMQGFVDIGAKPQAYDVKTLRSVFSH